LFFKNWLKWRQAGKPDLRCATPSAKFTQSNKMQERLSFVKSLVSAGAPNIEPKRQSALLSAIVVEDLDLFRLL
jgi:hypothetical protein